MGHERAHTVRGRQKQKPPEVYLFGYFRPQVTRYLIRSSCSNKDILAAYIRKYRER